MAFTDRQAKAKAQQIFDRFGELIHQACVGTGVKESFLAGFTGVEAGIDTKGNIKPEAKRFEAGVYAHLIGVRQGLHGSYDGITTRDLAGMSDDAIRNLATSWGCTQIMGWHLVHNLKGTVADLRDPNKHFHYTVQLLKIVGGSYMKRGDLASVLHIWNTGSANGKTYHEDYTTNALKVKTFYDELLTAKPFNSAAASIRDSAESNEHALTGEIDPTDEGTPGSTEQPPISDEPKMTLWQRMTGWTERLNVIGNFRSSLPEMPKMSAGSWVMTIWTKFWGWILFGIGIIWQNPWLLIPGLVLIILAVWYFSGSKDRATSRITPPAQAQEQTVVVK